MNDTMDSVVPAAGSSSSSLVILSVSIVGILGMALLLLSYYLFLTRCGLLFFWRTDDHRISVPRHDDDQQPSSGGLEEAAIRRIPTFRHGRRKGLPEECAVCLAGFRDGERLRLLPACRHAFHIDCIDVWLQANANCPLCRAPVAVIDDDYDQAQAAAAAATCFFGRRRSLSMGSPCTDKRALHRILQQQNNNPIIDAGKVMGEASSRSLRRSFFSFNHTHSRGSSILPL